MDKYQSGEPRPAALLGQLYSSHNSSTLFNLPYSQGSLAKYTCHASPTIRWVCYAIVATKTGITSADTATGTERMHITTGGNVGIGTTSPSYTLHVVGTAGLSTGTSWTNASDIRLKDVEGDYEYGLAEVKKLHTIRFRYKKDNPLNLPYEQDHTG